MDVEKLIRKYAGKGHMMQIATVDGDQPWCSTVYFVSDERLNLYWVSTPWRRHSKEIENHKKSAVAIPIKHTPGKKVIGLQAEGEAAVIENQKEIEHAIRLYTDRYKRGEEWYQDFLAGKNKHKLYRLKPRLFVLFDEERFPEDPRKEWSL